MRQRRRDLRHGGIAAAVHPHRTAAPRLRSDPLHRVVAVAAFVGGVEGEAALAATHATDLLDHDGIAGLDVAQHAQALEAQRRFLVRRSQQDRRDGPGALRGQPHVGVEPDAVAHGQAQAVLGQHQVDWE